MSAPFDEHLMRLVDGEPSDAAPLTDVDRLEAARQTLGSIQALVRRACDPGEVALWPAIADQLGLPADEQEPADASEGLLGRLLDGELSPEGERELRSRLADDPQRLGWLNKRRALSAALRDALLAGTAGVADIWPLVALRLQIDGPLGDQQRLALSLLADGELPQEQATELRTWIDNSPEARAEYERLAALSDLVRRGCAVEDPVLWPLLRQQLGLAAASEAEAEHDEARAFAAMLEADRAGSDLPGFAPIAAGLRAELATPDASLGDLVLARLDLLEEGTELSRALAHDGEGRAQQSDPALSKLGDALRGELRSAVPADPAMTDLVMTRLGLREEAARPDLSSGLAQACRAAAEGTDLWSAIAADLGLPAEARADRWEDADADEREMLLSAWLDDELGAADRARVDAWMEHSEEARSIASGMRRAGEVLRVAGREATAPLDLWSDLAGRLPEQGETREEAAGLDPAPQPEPELVRPDGAISLDAARARRAAPARRQERPLRPAEKVVARLFQPWALVAAAAILLVGVFVPPPRTTQGENWKRLLGVPDGPAQEVASNAITIESLNVGTGTAFVLAGMKVEEPTIIWVEPKGKG